MDRLTPDNFPLRAIGVNVYGRMWSSPILIADSPETALAVVGSLNDYALIKMKVQRDGPVLVTPPGMLDVNW